jgi:hypothetical protein
MAPFGCDQVIRRDAAYLIGSMPRSRQIVFASNIADFRMPRDRRPFSQGCVLPPGVARTLTNLSLLARLPKELD